MEYHVCTGIYVCVTLGNTILLRSYSIIFVTLSAPYYSLANDQEPFCSVVKRSSSKNDGQNFLTPVLAVTTVNIGVPTSRHQIGV